MSRVAATIKPLLRPHLNDMERKIAPGFAVLTWTSLNIDGYLHRFKQGLARLEELVRKVLDLVENRVESNLRAISGTMLVELPSDRSFTYEEFVTTQQRFQKKQAEQLAIRNEEVGAAGAGYLVGGGTGAGRRAGLRQAMRHGGDERRGPLGRRDGDGGGQGFTPVSPARVALPLVLPCLPIRGTWHWVDAV